MEHAPQNRRLDCLLAALLAAIAFAAFARAIPYAFLNWDDEIYVRYNPWLLNPGWDNIRRVFGHFYFSNYHPLTLISYMLDFRLHGYDPAGFRVPNLLLHAATVALGYAFARQLGAAAWTAFAAMLLFAVHPLRIESVVWISERKDVLCGFFYVAALVLWSAAGRGREAPLLVAACAALLLSFLAKPMAVSLPPLLILHDALFARDRMRRRIPIYIAMAATAAAFAALNHMAQTKSVAGDAPLSTRLGMAFYAPLHYTLGTLWPAGISPLYPFEERPSQHPLPLAAGVAFAVAALAVSLQSVRRAPPLAFGLLGSALVLGPVSGIVAFGLAYAADRYSYLPSLVLAAGIAAAAQPLVCQRSPRARHAIGGVAAVAALALFAATQSLLPHWRDREALWARAKSLYPANTAVGRNFADAELRGRGVQPAAAPPAAGPVHRFDVLVLLRAGRTDEAFNLAGKLPDPEDRLERQLAILRDANQWEHSIPIARTAAAHRPRLSAEVLGNAALALILGGHVDEGAALLETIGEPAASAAFAFSELAAARHRAGNVAAMESAARRALAIFPAAPTAVRTLGDHLMAARRLDEADALFRRAAANPAARMGIRAYAIHQRGKIAAARGEDPSPIISDLLAVRPGPETTRSEAADAFAYIGFLCEEWRRPADAAEFYARALAHVPTQLDALLGLGYIRLAQGNPPAAIRILEAAVAAHPNDEAARENLKLARERGAALRQ